MNFEVYEGEMSVMTIAAENEKHAWQLLKKAGIRNQSKLMSVIRID